MARATRTRAPTTITVEDYAHLEDLWDEPPPVATATLSPDRLQGVWRTIDGHRAASMLISGDHITVHFADGDIYMGTFTLATSASLITMDVLIKEGPRWHKGLTALCICDLSGNTMRWCTAMPGRSERPTTFDDSNPHLLCLTFSRENRSGGR